MFRCSGQPSPQFVMISNLAVLNLASGAAVVAGDASRVGAFLEKARLVTHADRVRSGQIVLQRRVERAEQSELAFAM
jgi:hypothetical protein